MSGQEACSTKSGANFILFIKRKILLEEEEENESGVSC